MSTSSLGALALGMFLAFASVVYFQLLPKPVPGIPHNPITSIWGDIPDIAQFTKEKKLTFGEYIANSVEKYGPLLQIFMGSHPVVVVADRLEAERIVLRGKNTEQPKRINQIFATVIPASQISFPTDVNWKRHRRLISISMSRRYLLPASLRISTVANDLMRFWSKKVDLIGDMAFDAEIDLDLAATDTIFSISMGISTSWIDGAYNSLVNLASTTRLTHIPRPTSPPLHAALQTIGLAVQQVMEAAYPTLTAWFFIWPTPTWRKNYGMIKRLFNQEIDRARMQVDNTKGKEAIKDADCVLDMIVQREALPGAERLKKDELFDELLTYVIAGGGATAAVLAWLVKYLPLDLEIQQKLHDEVCDVFGLPSGGGKEIDFESVDNSDRVPILEAVVAETLRCAGVGSYFFRELTEDTVVLGKHIPKGTELLFPAVLLSTQESDWGPDAKIWRPSRWLRADGSFDRAAGPSLPFGMGQRSCYGQRLAVLQAKIFVATLSRVFMFKPIPKELDSWDAIETESRHPMSCFVSLERWP